MRTVDFETAIADFLALGKRLQGEAESLTGERVLQELTDWYRTTRVAGAALEDGGDMLLLQWGGMTPLLRIVNPTDMRGLKDDEVKFDKLSRQFLDFTRQVCRISGDDDDFDDSAVQMSMTLFYQPASGKEPESNTWIRHPDAVGSAVTKYAAIPYVRSLFALTATRVCITVGHCG